MKKTYKQCFAWGYEQLAASGVSDARIDARLLLEYVCGTSQHDLLLHGDREVTSKEQEQYEACIARRSERIPLQHITGVQAFMGYEFQVNEHVLIPRQDTEILVETALEYLRPDMRVLDMCTGSGCILLSLLALGDASVSGVGVDISPEALQVAQANLQGISAQCARPIHAVFVESDLFSVWDSDPLASVQQETANFHEFDMIVSNPPYIASAVIDTLEPEVRLHEPIRALDGTADGLLFYRKIVAESTAYLRKGGILLFEIGYDQGEAVAELMHSAGFSGVTVKQDYAGLDRVVYGFFEEETRCLTN